jgi:hypothetical protein
MRASERMDRAEQTPARDELRSSLAALSGRLLSEEGGSAPARSAAALQRCSFGVNKGTNRHECLNPGGTPGYPRTSAPSRLLEPITNSLPAA